MNYIFRILISAISIYTLLCSIRIILTWIPGAAYNGFVRFLSSLCDPFLHLFSGIRWLRLGNLDFSPVLALGLLSICSSILQNIMMIGRISVGSILAMIISLVWSLFSSIVTFFIVILVIRLIMLLVNRGRESASNIWSQIDYSINPFVLRISSFFSGGKPVSYQNALIISVVSMIVVLFAGRYLMAWISTLLLRIPF